MRALVRLAPFLLLGCGSSVSTAGWVGSWTATVVETEMCGSSSGQHSNGPNCAVVIANGIASGTIVTQPLNGCDLTWTVNGSNATLASSQSCPTVPSASGGGTWTPTFTSGLLTLNGNTMGFSASGMAQYLPPSGAAVPCTFSQSGTLTLH